MGAPTCKNTATNVARTALQSCNLNKREWKPVTVPSPRKHPNVITISYVKPTNNACMVYCAAEIVRKVTLIHACAAIPSTCSVNCKKF
jgi:hypothetical protein